MIIWIINPYAVPPTLGGLNRHYFFKKYLRKNGHDVYVFSSSAVYNRNTNLFTKHEKGLFKKIVFDDEEMIFVKAPSRSGIVKRLFSIHSFCKRVRKIAKKGFFKKPDIIYVSVSPEFEIGFLGAKLKKIFKCPLVIELRDLYPDTLVSLNVIKRKSFLYRFLSFLSKKMLYCSDSLVFTMDGGKQYVVDKKMDVGHGGNIDLNNVYIINNGVDLDYFRIRENISYNDPDLDDKNIKCIVYTGSLGIANDIDRILDIAKLIKTPNIKFVIWGNGRKKPDLERRINDEHICNVVLKDSVDGNLIPAILKKSFLTIVTQKDIQCDSLYGISSNKSFQYFAAGKPVVLLINAPFPNFDKYSPGLQLKNNNAKENAIKLDNFLSAIRNNDIYADFCFRSFKISEMYDYKKIAIRFEQALKETINRNREYE